MAQAPRLPGSDLGKPIEELHLHHNLTFPSGPAARATPFCQQESKLNTPLESMGEQGGGLSWKQKEMGTPVWDREGAVEGEGGGGQASP